MLLPTLIFQMWSQLSLAAWAYNTACHCYRFISSTSPASILLCWHYCIPVVNLFTWHKLIYSYDKLFKYIEDLVSKLLRGLVEGVGLWGKCVNAFCFHSAGMVKRRSFRGPLVGDLIRWNSRVQLCNVSHLMEKWWFHLTLIHPMEAGVPWTPGPGKERVGQPLPVLACSRVELRMFTHSYLI